MEKVPVINTPTAILNEMIPAASLSKDSPSRMVIEPFGKTLPFVIAYSNSVCGQRIGNCESSTYR